MFMLYVPRGLGSFPRFKDITQISGMYPKISGMCPKMPGMRPRISGTYPGILGRIPRFLGSLPRFLGRVPKFLGRVPEISWDASQSRIYKHVMFTMKNKMKSLTQVQSSSVKITRNMSWTFPPKSFRVEWGHFSFPAWVIAVLAEILGKVRFIIENKKF